MTPEGVPAQDPAPDPAPDPAGADVPDPAPDPAGADVPDPAPDPAGADVPHPAPDPAGSDERHADRGGLLDGGAVFAGWVGLGMALVVAISLELIIAVQPLVFLLAPLSGLLIGAYANQRSERWRPARKVLVNAAYAGLVTGVGLAVIYASLRLLFVFADTGFRGPGQGGQLDCQPGPQCTYLRYVAEGRADDLASAGVVDGESFGRFVVREQLSGALVLVTITLGGALVAGGVRIVRGPRTADPGSQGQ